MNAAITRDIITDLLPAYLSGDASADTRALVESYLAEDREFAALIKNEAKVVFPDRPLPPESGLRAFHKTRRALHRRAWHLALALLFTVVTVTFHIGPEGVEWTWPYSHALAVSSGVLALGFWLAFFHTRRALRKTGV